MAKGNEELDERELRAARVMRSILGAPSWMIVPKDIKGAPPGTHDFELTDGAMTIAVEISTIADPDTISNYAGWSRGFPGGAICLDGLKHGWLLMVDSDANARYVQKNVAVWLADLERRNERSVQTDLWQAHALTPAPQRPPWFDTLWAMARARVKHAEVDDTLPAGQCHVSVVDGGFSYSVTDPNYFASFVSAQLATSHASDVTKLGRAPADRRVLFLWLDAQSHFDVVRRLDHGLFRGALSNTGKLDEVWVGRRFQDGSVTVYRWQGNADWHQANLEATKLGADDGS